MRTMVVWCPDWSVTAGLLELADGRGEDDPALDAGAPAVVLANNRVVVCNATARAEYDRPAAA